MAKSEKTKELKKTDNRAGDSLQIPKNTLRWALLVLAVIVIAVVIFKPFTAPTTPSATPTPTAKPATVPVVKIVKLTTPSCADCADVEKIARAIKSLGIIVSKEVSVDYQSVEGQKIVQDLQLKGVPTAVVYVEDGLDKAGPLFANLFENRGGGVFVYKKLVPIYLNTTDNKKTGLINTVILDDPNCVGCGNPRKLLDDLAALGVKFGPRLAVDYNTLQGRGWIEKYGVLKVPTVIFSPDISAYPGLVSELAPYGNLSEDGSFILTNVIPPYRDLVTKNVTGYVNFTYLQYKACTNCSSADLHRSILQKRGVTAFSETVFDADSAPGKALIAKYNLTKIPTIIVSPQIALYPGMDEVLKAAYSQESDGTYVFRNFEALPNANYFDLVTNQTMVRANQTRDIGVNTS